ncbi:TRAP-type C4-dicarboxylate transport system, periplasmic component [Marinobacterium lacunae]|uniref:TRAP-type C4-dicarboxylate transport system, periplasmic component n=1 Tax=Marinobacterium lacunae TaxID=1232683 RepID=A0A081FZK4_9GAMM|nr:TRAP transporter substrate-binding protein [Marinobacterium lacunae]KEA63959.1 TRAP-type C4-dicarboxylate transport system, periplasmic component [Marinobacterium lacunae]
MMKTMTIFGTALLSASLVMGSLPAVAGITARMGTSLPEEHPQTLGARKFAELVEQKTQGEVEVKVFSGGMLGNDVNMTSMLQAGTLAFTVPSTATLASLNGNFSIVSLPFQFDNEAHADAVLDGEVGQSLLRSLDDKGLEALAFWENGFRHLTNSRRPVETLEDLQGLKVRVMENNLYIDLFNTLQANAVPMPVNELFTALETRTVDAQENPYTVIASKRFFEVQPYLSQTAHAYDALVLLASAKFMDQLDESQQQAVREAAREATLYQRQVSRELNGTLLQELSDQMQVNAVPEAERKQMRESLAELIQRYQASLDQDLVTRFSQALDASRGQ